MELYSKRKNAQWLCSGIMRTETSEKSRLALGKSKLFYNCGVNLINIPYTITK